MMLHLMRPKRYFHTKRDSLNAKLLSESNAPSFSSHESIFYNQSKSTGKDSTFENSNRVSTDSFQSYTISTDILIFNRPDYLMFVTETPPRRQKSRAATADSDSAFFDQPVYGSPVNMHNASIFGDSSSSTQGGYINPLYMRVDDQMITSDLSDDDQEDQQSIPSPR